MLGALAALFSAPGVLAAILVAVGGVVIIAVFMLIDRAFATLVLLVAGAIILVVNHTNG